jgi:hypothetical protein
MGFEPTRAEPIGLAVQRLNHSATSSLYVTVAELSKTNNFAEIWFSRIPSFTWTQFI